MRPSQSITDQWLMIGAAIGASLSSLLGALALWLGKSTLGLVALSLGLLMLAVSIGALAVLNVTADGSSNDKMDGR